MNWFKRLSVVLATVAVIVSIAGTAPVNAATAQVGSVWSETLPSGERVQFQRTAEGMDVTTHAVARMDPFDCTHPYTCVWTDHDFTGTFGRYNTNNIYSNTANGVAHCWNMSAPFNNNTKSWANFSTDRPVRYNNWVNCNVNGGTMHMPVNSSWTCNYSDYSAWCGDPNQGFPRTTSIMAFA